MAKNVRNIILFLLTICILGGGGYFLFTQTNFVSKTCTVVFNANGGQVEQTSVEIPKGSTLSLPTPTKDGNKFIGWFSGEVQWTENDRVTANLTLLAKWEADKFNVTFMVDGQSYQQQFDYGQMPVFNGSVEKSSTDTKSYTFAGWLPELLPVTASATYTAQYTESERTFSVSVTSNISGVGNLTGAGDYIHNTETTVTASQVLGYDFLGWYSGDTQITPEYSLELSNITQDWQLVAKYQIIIKTITYNNTYGSSNPNPTNYTILDNTITLQSLSFVGYNFGWYTQSGGLGSCVTEIDCSTLTNYTLFGYRSTIDYSISYTLNGGELPSGQSNPVSYNIESEDIYIVNPSKTDSSFVGWSGSNINDTTLELIIYTGTTGNLHFIAVFTTNQKTVSLVVDGFELTNSQITQEINSSISSPTVNTADYGFSGYTIDGWYTSDSYQTKYEFPLTLNNDYILYGRWNYVLNQGFYDYYDTFSSMTKYSAININSYEMLVDYVDYVLFYDITESGYYFKFNYTISQSDEMAEIVKAFNSSCFPGGSISYGSSGSNYYVKVSSSTRSTDATLVADSEKAYTYTQANYAYAVSNTSRDDSYSSFKRDYIQQTITVETSNQLMYALEKGLKPVCKVGSSAESIYNKAKQVLKQICNDSMTDVEKMRAIYEWMILNVYYDNHAVATSSISNEWRKYDAWYAEGVFSNGVAVCDGISKAVVILAQIENIPCVRVTGTFNGGGHAWNKVCVGGIWYCMDVTHGNRSIVYSETDSSKNKEALTYSNFLMSDGENNARGALATTWTNLDCSSTFDYYDYVSYTYNSYNFDLLVDSTTELTNILKYAKAQGYSGGYTVEVRWNMASTFSSTINSCAISAGVSVSGSVSLSNSYTGSQYYIIFIS